LESVVGIDLVSVFHVDIYSSKQDTVANW